MPRKIEDIVDEMIARFEPRIARMFRQAMINVANEAQFNDLVAAIQLGDVNAAFRALGLTDAAMRPVTAMLERAFEEGGVAVGSKGFPKRLNTPNGSAVFRFDVRTSRAEKYLREQIVRLTTDTKRQQMEALQNALYEGTKRGQNPTSTARDIVGRYDNVAKRRVGGVVGLDGPSERAAARAREELLEGDWPSYERRKLRNKNFDSIVRKAWERGEGVDPKQAEQLVTRYKDRLLKNRGDRIGRTESMRALNQSAHEALKQAEDMGAIERSGVKRIWDSAGGDGRTRDSHLVADRYYSANPVGLDEPFRVGDSLLMYPGDPNGEAEEVINCRCRVRTEINWLGAVNG